MTPITQWGTAAGSGPPWLARLRPLLLFAVAATGVAAFWHFRVVAPIRGVGLSAQNFDDFVYYQPTFTYAFSELDAGRFPLWNPYQHAGTPFFATAQHLLLYPLNLLFLFLPTPAAMAGTTVLHLLLALVFTFVLARTIGLSRPAAATAGIAYAFSTAIVGLVYLPHHLYGTIWTPLLLALIHRVVSGRRRWGAALGLGVAAAAQYLGGYPMYCLLAAYACAAYALWLLVANARAGAPASALGGALLALAAAGVLAAALAAPQLLPATELAARSPRAFAALTIGDVDPYFRGVDPWQLLRATIFPGRNAQVFQPFPHIGLAALALAVLAPLHRARRADAVFFFLLALGSGLIGVGRHTPLFAWYYRLPTADWFRIPNRFYVLTVLGLAMLAGIGADWVLQRARGRWRQALAVALPGAAYASLFVVFINRVALPETHPTLHALPAPVVEFLRTHQDFARTYIPPPGLTGGGFTASAPSKSGMLYGLFVATDRENVYESRFARYVARLQNPEAQALVAAVVTSMFGNLSDLPQGEFRIDVDSPAWRLLDLLGTRFLVAPTSGLRTTGDTRTLPLVFAAKGVEVYRNPTELPRAYVVNDYAVLAADAVLDRLVDPAFDPRASVILEQAPAELAPAAAPVAPGQARIRSYAAEEVVVDTESAAPGLLVLTDQDYPGWEAEVDGAPAPIYRANYLFRAVPIPTGSHRVVFRFRPRSVREGMVIGAIGLAALALAAPALAWRARRDDGR